MESETGLIANGKTVGVYATAQTMLFIRSAIPCDPIK
jgi:hypothetical protein